jgi:acyl-CoA oxidase
LFRNKNFITKNQTNSVHLRNLDLYIDAFVYREFKMLRVLTNKLRNKVKAGKEATEAWNECLDIVLALGKAYVDRISIEKYIEAVLTADVASRPMLETLCCLFALSKIEQDMGWFLTHKYFSPSKAKAISEEVNVLCSELRPHALKVIEGE